VLCIEPGWILAKLRQIVELILFALSSFALLFIVQRTVEPKAPVVRGASARLHALPSRRQKKDGHLKVAATRSEAQAAVGLPPAIQKVPLRIATRGCYGKRLGHADTH
jgi:hypothetical protein